MIPNSLGARDIEAHFHPMTNLAALTETAPLVITRGEGVRVFDDQGRGYIEGMSGLWCAALGFSEPRLAEAAAAQMKRLSFYHGFTAKTHDVVIELAEQLKAIAPVPMARVFFANSGSEANDTAIKLVRYVNNARGRPEKKKVIARERAYHGVTIASGSLTGLPAFHGNFDLPMDGVLHTSCPHYWKYAEEGEAEDAFAERCAEDLDALICAEGPETVAAFFAEPVMGAGGVIVPPKGYFEKIAKVLKAHDVLLVADEVICGFGRTGAMWGSQTFDIAPDILTCAKALSNGAVPISAVMVGQEIYDEIAAASGKLGLFGHGFTYSGHPVGAAVALETLRIYEERGIVARAREMAPLLQQGLKRLAEHPLVGEARGVGMVGALELVSDKGTRAPFDPKAAVGPHAVARAQDRGLILRALGDTLAFSPPLIIAEDEIKAMLDATAGALDDTLDRVRDEGLGPAA